MARPKGSATSKAGLQGRDRPPAATLGLVAQLPARRLRLAIAAVLDIALNGGPAPVPAKALAARQNLPPRHLEPVLQALVRNGILKGTRGPRGGYRVAASEDRITCADILHAIAGMEDEDSDDGLSPLVAATVDPALGEAGEAYVAALEAVSLSDLRARAGG